MLFIHRKHLLRQFCKAFQLDRENPAPLLLGISSECFNNSDPGAVGTMLQEYPHGLQSVDSNIADKPQDKSLSSGIYSAEFSVRDNRAQRGSGAARQQLQAEISRAMDRSQRKFPTVRSKHWLMPGICRSREFENRCSLRATLPFSRWPGHGEEGSRYQRECFGRDAQKFGATTSVAAGSLPH